ncbi:MAG TPA: GntR family transcriptional regulator [Burkholderiaceae bacterium]|jgi:GntR family transcriptional regulator
MQTASVKSTQRLYESVRARVVDRLQSGHWSPGDRIPTETQLASEFGVGIGTIRRAVGELVAEGVLVRRARLGTTVARHTDEHSFDLYFSFVDAAGKPVKLSARLLSFKKERASPEVSAALRLEHGARVARIENLRSLNGEPLMLDRIWVPLDRFADLNAELFAARPSSIYRFYQDHFGISVVRVVEDLGACVADPALARPLALAPNDPLLRIQRTGFTYHDTPVEFRLRFVNSAGCQYRNIRGLQD